MAQAQASPSDRIRIAIALAALQFKPPDRSLAAYILDLRAAFAPSVPVAPTADGSWRTHALALERDYAELEAKYEAAQIHSMMASVSTSFGSAPTAPSSSLEQPASTTDSKTKKRKKKRPAGALESQMDLDQAPCSSTKTHTFGKTHILRIPGPESLVGALDAFSQLHEHTRVGGRAPGALVLSTTLRAIDAISRVLCQVLAKPHPSHSDATLLDNLGQCAQGVLLAALPLLSPASTVDTYDIDGSTGLDALVAHVLAGLLQPLLHSFAPLSQTHTCALLFAPTSTSQAATSTPDLRPHTLSLFSTLLHVLVPDPPQRENTIPAGLQGRAYDLCATLALSTLRALAQVLSPTEGIPGSSLAPTPNLTPLAYSTLSQPGGGAATRVPLPSSGASGARSIFASPSASEGLRTARPERVARLARGEAMWYLCQILHALFSGHPEPTEPPSVIQDDILLGAFLGVLRCCGGPTPDAPPDPDVHHECDIGVQGRLPAPGQGLGDSGAVGGVQDSSNRGPGCQATDELGGKVLGWGMVEVAEECVHGGRALRAGGKGEKDMEGGQLGPQAQRREMTDHWMGEVGRGMLLGVVEQYWRWRGGDPGTDGLYDG